MKLLRPARILVLVVLLTAGLLAFRLLTPYRGFTAPVFVDFPHGASTAELANRLAEAGVVRGKWDFLLARTLARARVLQAGEYQFKESASPLAVVRRIARGDIFYYTLVVPEGKNMFDVAEILAGMGLFPESSFIAAARNPALIRDLDPAAPSLEGYLFPNTYRLSRHSTPESVCRLMTARFREAWDSLNSSRSAHDTVTLASLVEKESKLPEERPQVAAVFENRLRIGMKLDCDPTTIYAALLDRRYRGTIYRSDLENRNPYNTYQHAGLPPGPIANPGLDSLRAVLHPAASSALYFVLRPDGSGAHHFSDTIAEHRAATARYRHGRGK